MRGFLLRSGIIAVLFALMPGLAMAEQVWWYQETVNEMDDSVWQRITAYSTDRKWIGVIHCAHPDRIVLWWENALTRLKGIVRMRFDKAQATEHTLYYGENARAMILQYDGVDNQLLENAVLRIQIPAKVAGDARLIVRFDLLDFNPAWDNCPPPPEPDPDQDADTESDSSTDQNDQQGNG